MKQVVVWNRRQDKQWQPVRNGEKGFGHSFNLMYWRWNRRPNEYDAMRYWQS